MGNFKKSWVIWSSWTPLANMNPRSKIVDPPLIHHHMLYFKQEDEWKYAFNFYQGYYFLEKKLKKKCTSIIPVTSCYIHVAVGASPVSGSQPYRPRTDIPQKERETRLHQVAVQLIEGEAINSTAIKIYWQVCNKIFNVLLNSLTVSSFKIEVTVSFPTSWTRKIFAIIILNNQLFGFAIV